MDVVERWTRPNKQTLHYEATVTDPGAYTRPFTVAWDIPWRRGRRAAWLHLPGEQSATSNRLEDDLGQPIFGPRPQPGAETATTRSHASDVDACSTSSRGDLVLAVMLSAGGASRSSGTR